MDMQLKSSTIVAGQFNTWDYEIKDGIVPLLTDGGQANSSEDSQRATIAAFLQKGTIPQLPQVGIEWMEYFTGQVNFGVVDGEIKSALIANGLGKFYPTYDLVNGNLKVQVAQV